MTKFSWPLKNKNEGASLVAVLMAIFFVMTLGGIVATVTVTNIRMRQVEESSKGNFYNAEMIVDEIAVYMNNKAAEAMQLAYTDILSDYRNIMVNGASLQKEFAYRYMNELIKAFGNSQPTMSTPDPTDNSKTVYVYGYYDHDKIRQTLKDVKYDEETEDFRDYFVTQDGDAAFSADFVDGLFTVYGIKVDYTDKYGYKTVISTDMVFRTPTLNFDSGYKVKDFMKYALIADDQINLFGENVVSVKGNMYSGPGGIYVVNSNNASFVGNTIVTRGDINVDWGSKAVFGDASSNIWAENIVTSGKKESSASEVTINGNIYVADDLTMNGSNGVVKLTGNYYGYNFFKQYDGTDLTGARYSSAITINGKNSRLDMSGLQYLHLAGRTYIARKSGDSDPQYDVALGESLSVRTNQLAYYVPANYMKRDANGKIINTPASSADFSEDGEEQYSEYINVENVGSYLKSGNPIAVYRFQDKNGEDVYRYYLNFENDQKANDFFKAYSMANADKINTYGNDYADAIIIDENTLYTLKGDVMLRASASDNYDVKAVTIENAYWENSGVYYDFADQMAKNYMSLQLYLEDWRFHADTIKKSDVRFENDNKAASPLTGQLLDMSKLLEMPYKDNDNDRTANSGEPLIVVQNCGNYTIENADEGIVIVTGDVTVQHNFSGMIIAGGTIYLAKTDLHVESNELLVAEMFAEDVKKENPEFSYLFTTYGTVADNVIGLVQIDKYMTYQNWTRTEQ